MCGRKETARTRCIAEAPEREKTATRPAHVRRTLTKGIEQSYLAIGSAGNQYIPAASVGSRRTLLPLALERRAVAPDAPAPPGVSDSQLRTPWPVWPQGPGGGRPECI